MEKNIYDPKNIEDKWVKIWEENKTYSTPANPPTDKDGKPIPKMHVLDMFPYPSGEGLHTGHTKIFGASDAFTRFKRMQGFNVLHATGWDAFGLPAEQYAIKNKVNPKISTKKNTANFEKQMKMLGLSYDWDRTVNTTDPKFYKWTQWIFKQLYKDGLCYESYEPINWCPSCKTGLANEDLEDGKCERCGSIVEKKPIRQWVIKITEYAEKLLSGVDNLDWKESIKEMQRNWIGKSEGAEIDFELISSPLQGEVGRGSKFTIFTTRPDTLFGCTYCVFAPENKLVKEYLDKNLILNKKVVEEYIQISKDKTEIERTAVGKEKTGVKLEGVFAINPANQKQVPVYIADYVLANYGTGAIMAVPAHDERDFEFAKKYNIEINNVIDISTRYLEDKIVGSKQMNDEEIKEKILDLKEKFSKNEFPFTEEGFLISSEKFTGLESEIAKKEITEFVGGKMVTKYKLRDWVFARQRYWGEPFPIVFDENHKPYLVADSELPVVLPDVESYEPTGDGEGPLKNIPEFLEVWGSINDDGEFVSSTSPNLSLQRRGTEQGAGEIKKFFRETNTMPQWAGSSWYWLRYMDPHNENFLVGEKQEKYWAQNGYGVDMYLGGMEHATRHLIYGRFWNLFLKDKGILSHAEPFKRLEAVGLVLGEGGVKMSKRLGNVVNPDDMVKQFGADTLRLYIAFAADYHDSFAWDTKAIVGPRRFIERVWNLQYKISQSNSEKNEEIETLLNQTIKKVEEDYEKLQFNTAIAQLMIFVNAVEKQGTISIEDYKILLKLIAPICPFFTEEVWNVLGEKESIHKSAWPKYDVNKITNKTVNIAVQINGKLRDLFVTETDQVDEEIIRLAKQTEGYKKWVGEVEPKKIIVVKNKIVNIIV